MEKFTEKIPTPSEKNENQPRFIAQENLSEANKGGLNRKIESL